MVTLRKYQHSDKQSLIELWLHVFPDPAPHHDPTLVLEEKLKMNDLIFIAEKAGRVIGSCIAGYDGHRGWLYAVSVSSEVRRMGIGSKLAKHSIKQLHRLGCAKVNLQIVAGNEEVVKFYQSLGFNIEERISMGMLSDNNN